MPTVQGGRVSKNVSSFARFIALLKMTRPFSEIP
jgi:hypothetical protein